jgi:hypothetical protein
MTTRRIVGTWNPKREKGDKWPSDSKVSCGHCNKRVSVDKVTWEGGIPICNNCRRQAYR